jgi:hypothetical protein
MGSFTSRSTSSSTPGPPYVCANTQLVVANRVGLGLGRWFLMFLYFFILSKIMVSINESIQKKYLRHAAGACALNQTDKKRGATDFSVSGPTQRTETDINCVRNGRGYRRCPLATPTHCRHEKRSSVSVCVGPWIPNWLFFSAYLFWSGSIPTAWRIFFNNIFDRKVIYIVLKKEKTHLK